MGEGPCLVQRLVHRDSMMRLGLIASIGAVIARTGFAANPVSISIDTGNELPVVALGELPVLVMSNACEHGRSLTVDVRAEEVLGHSHVTTTFTRHLPSGCGCRLPVEGLASKGVWQIEVSVLEGTSSVERVIRRVAVLDHHPITPRASQGAFRHGIHVHCGRYPASLSDRVVAAVARAGATLVRTDYGFMFSDVYPDGPGTPHWDKADKLMDSFRRHGLALDAIIYGNPPWARMPELVAARGRGEFSVAPRAGLFGAFAGEIAQRYGADVAYYEIGNELDAISSSKLPPVEYLRVLREAYGSIKAVAPSASVIPCGWAFMGAHSGAAPLWGNPDLAVTVQREGADFYDAWPIHGHGPYERFSHDLEEVFFRDRKANGADGKPWLCNETARTSAMGAEKAAAVDVWRKILYARSRGARDYIWYNLRAVNRDPGSGEGGYGMMTMDLEPRAAYATFSALTALLEGFEFERAVVSKGARQLFVYSGSCDEAPCRLVVGWYDGFAQGTDVHVRTDAVKAFACDIMNNRSPVPVENGTVTFRWSDTPSALLLVGCAEVACAPDDLMVEAPPPSPRVLGGDPKRPRDFELSDADGYVVNVHEGMPHLQHRLWQGWKDAFTRLHFDRVGEDAIRVTASGQDDRRGAQDGIELGFGNGRGGWKTVTIRPVARSGVVDEYDAVLTSQDTGLTGKDMTDGFDLSIRLLDDDGEGLDCWLQLGPGADVPFVPVRFEPMPAKDDKPLCRIVYDRGRPYFEIGGSRYDTALYNVSQFWRGDNPRLRRQVEYFRDAGMHLYGLGENTPDVWREDGSIDFERAILPMKSAMEIDPEARFLYSINTVLPPRWWVERHPDELVGYANGSVNVDERECMRNCAAGSAASAVWRKDICDFQRRLVAYLEASPYASRIFAYRPDWGVNHEWHYYGMFGYMPDNGKAMTKCFRTWLRKAYANDLVAFQSAWRDTHVTFETAETPSVAMRRRKSAGRLRDDVLERPVLDYERCHAETLRNFIIESDRSVKEACGGRALVGNYGGYYFGVIAPAEGWHLENDAVLDSPYVDFQCSPQIYGTEARKLGSGQYARCLLEGLRRRGKLSIQEADKATSTSGSRYSLWTKTREDDLVLLSRDFVQTLCWGCGFWYFDFGAGFYADPVYADYFRQIYEIWRTPADCTSISEVLVVGDYESVMYSHVDWPASDYGKLITRQVNAMSSAGVPFDSASFADLASGGLRDYRVYVLPNCCRMAPWKMTALDRVRECGGKIVWVGEAAAPKAEDLVFPDPMDRSALIDLYRSLGVHVYCDEPETAVYACRSYVALHSAKPGCKTIRLKAPARIDQVYPARRSLGFGREIPVESSGATTVLFRIDGVE